MYSTIKSIKLQQENNDYYWLIEILDNTGKTRLINTSKINDASSFRKLTFGLFYILNKNNILYYLKDKELSVFYDGTMTGIKTLKNSNGDYISIINGTLQAGNNTDTTSMKPGKISSINFQSGSILVNVKQTYGSQNFGGLNLLSGLGYPLSRLETTEISKNSNLVAEDFKKFIISILKVCGITNLLENCEEKELPKVNIELDNLGNVIKINSTINDVSISFNSSGVLLTKKVEIKDNLETPKIDFSKVKDIFEELGFEDKEKDYNIYYNEKHKQK
jgi:hypothetical protein